MTRAERPGLVGSGTMDERPGLVSGRTTCEDRRALWRALFRRLFGGRRSGD